MASRDLVYHDLLLALSQELPDCELEVRTDTSCTSPEEVLQSGVDALRSKVDFWETLCAEIGAGSDVEE